MPEVVVADSGPLIALATIGQLDLLKAIYDEVLVPPAVIREVVEAGAGGPGAAEIDGAAWLRRVSVDSPPEALLLQELGPGEAEVIAVASQRGGACVLLDERQARRIAELAYRLTVRGTVGTLVVAKRRGLVSEIRPLLEALRTSGYFLMNFYTKVLSRFARESGLKLVVVVEIAPDGGVSEQNIDETRIALRELGLKDDVKTS